MGTFFRQWRASAIGRLSPLHGEREASNLIKYLVQDLGFMNFSDESEVPHVLQEALDRLLQAEPLQYVTGKAYFMDLVLKVTPAVLIPRPETEELVDQILQYARSRTQHQLRIIDLGTGSGCIPLALKKHLPSAEIHSVDISESALQVAYENATNLGLEIQLHCIDILNEAEKLYAIGPKWDIIVSNPPYIPVAERSKMEDNVVRYEPSIALFTIHPDGQEFYSAIANFAERSLAKKGHIFLELNEFRAAQSRQIFVEKGFQSVISKDINGRSRMLIARHKIT